MGTSKQRGRHGSWPGSLKREIVAASLVAGALVSRVARRCDVNATQVFAWRRRYRGEPAEPAELRLLPVRGDAGPAGGDGTGPRERGDRDRVGRGVSCSRQRGCPGRDAAAGAGGPGAAMIPIPSGVRVWLAVGRTD